MKKFFLILLLLVNFLGAYETLTNQQYKNIMEILKMIMSDNKLLSGAEQFCNEPKFYWNFALSNFCARVATITRNNSDIAKLDQKACDSFEETYFGFDCLLTALMYKGKRDNTKAEEYFKKAHKPLLYFCDEKNVGAACSGLANFYRFYKNNEKEAEYYRKRACKLDQDFCE